MAYLKLGPVTREINPQSPAMILHLDCGIVYEEQTLLLLTGKVV